MEKELKLFHKLLPIILIPICFLIFAGFGWSSFATITERSGLNEDMHMYYKLSKFQYANYTSFVSLVGLLLILLQVYFLALKKVCNVDKNILVLSDFYWITYYL